MSRKNKRIGIFVLLAATLIGLVFFFRSDAPRHDWRETYSYDSREPYGTQVLFQLLEGYFEGQPVEVLDDSLALPPPSAPPSNYILIGGGVFLDSLETGRLLEYIAAGNRAFISSRVLPYELTYEAVPQLECPDGYWYWSDYLDYSDSSVVFSLLHPKLKDTVTHRFTYQYQDQHPAYRWQYFDPVLFCESESGLVALGTLNDSLPNFTRIPYGRGFLYLHTAPIAFSNLELLEKPALRYADRVFSHLVEGPVYWDEQGKVSEEVARRRNQTAGVSAPERRLNAEGPLQYVLQEPSLTWAWYLLLALSLLYLLFRAKRRQRVIPVLEKNTNTSMEFLATIGRLYFLQNDHRNLAAQEMKLFRTFVREHYGLQARQSQNEFVEKLAGKSEIPEGVIREILQQYRTIEKAKRISNDQLIAFHQKVEYFYKHCK